MDVARDLLGQCLVRIETDGKRTSGLIVEAEAYVGTDDLGCHASAGRTPRNEVMWGPPGHAYVYFTYGMHWMLNLTTEAEGSPAAVLLRAILPLDGEHRMRRRRASWRKQRKIFTPIPSAKLTDGPAKLAQALRIDGSWNGHDLCLAQSRIFVEKRPSNLRVTVGPRVGLNTVPEPWKSIPWRFRLPRADFQLVLEQEEHQ